jgi:hypothetical protein
MFKTVARELCGKRFLGNKSDGNSLPQTYVNIHFLMKDLN